LAVDLLAATGADQIVRVDTAGLGANRGRAHSGLPGGRWCEVVLAPWAGRLAVPAA
jgi:hypothetical protein